MLGIFPRATQKCADIDIGYLTTRWDIRFMPDKYVPRGGIAAQKPPIPIRTAVQFSPLQGHWFVLGLTLNAATSAALLRNQAPRQTPPPRRSMDFAVDGTPLHRVGFLSKL